LRFIKSLILLKKKTIYLVFKYSITLALSSAFFNPGYIIFVPGYIPLGLASHLSKFVSSQVMPDSLSAFEYFVKSVEAAFLPTIPTK